MADTIVVAASLAQRPGYGGHTWALLQYVLGFRRLGWDVLFLDWLIPEMCVDSRGEPCPPTKSVNLQYFMSVMEGFGLEGSFALGIDDEGWVIGLDRKRVHEHVREACFLLNVMGFLEDEDALASCRRKVFLDIDPGFGQMWRALGLHDPFSSHDTFVTIAESMGEAGCRVPDCGLGWVATPQPVVLDYWPAVEANGGPFTSVATWRGPFGPLEFKGHRYGLRVHEFRKFVSLPSLTRVPFELALDIHPGELDDLALLSSEKWSLVEPRAVTGDPWLYQDYIQRSRAEFMVAKNMYVDTRGGWFSDRSICYLASGKPVLAQDTGFSDHYPTGEGLLSFSTIDEAAAGVEMINADYESHSRRARSIAEEYFDSNKVLTRLVDRLGV